MTTDLSTIFWGPHFWSMYHIYAGTYPIVPTPIIAEYARLFIRGIPFTLPCSMCANHAFAYIQYIHQADPNLDNIVNSRENMITFFIDFHNAVNYRLGKPLLSMFDAKRKWSFG